MEMQGSDHAPVWADWNLAAPLPTPEAAPPLSTRYLFTGMHTHTCIHIHASVCTHLHVYELHRNKLRRQCEGGVSWVPNCFYEHSRIAFMNIA